MLPTTRPATRTSAVRTRCSRARTPLGLRPAGGGRRAASAAVGAGLVAAAGSGLVAAVLLGLAGRRGTVLAGGLRLAVRTVLLAVRATAIVSAVEAAALKDNAHGLQQPAHAAAARLAGGQRGIGESLALFDLCVTIGTLIDVDWHGTPAPSASIGRVIR